MLAAQFMSYGSLVKAYNPKCVFITTKFLDSSHKINCAYASLRSILGKGYWVPCKTGFNVTLKSPHNLIVLSGLRTGTTGVAQLECSTGIKTSFLTNLFISSHHR